MSDGNLLERLRVTYLPSIMILVEGRVIHYRGNVQSLTAKFVFFHCWQSIFMFRSVRLFARDVIPNTFLTRINSRDKLTRFVDLWRQSNKVWLLFKFCAANSSLLGVGSGPRICPRTPITVSIGSNEIFWNSPLRICSSRRFKSVFYL